MNCLPLLSYLSKHELIAFKWNVIAMGPKVEEEAEPEPPEPFEYNEDWANVAGHRRRFIDSWSTAKRNTLERNKIQHQTFSLWFRTLILSTCSLFFLHSFIFISFSFLRIFQLFVHFSTRNVRWWMAKFRRKYWKIIIKKWNNIGYR